MSFDLNSTATANFPRLDSQFRDDDAKLQSDLSLQIPQEGEFRDEQNLFSLQVEDPRKSTAKASLNKEAILFSSLNLLYL